MSTLEAEQNHLALQWVALKEEAWHNLGTILLDEVKQEDEQELFLQELILVQVMLVVVKQALKWKACIVQIAKPQYVGEMPPRLEMQSSVQDVL